MGEKTGIPWTDSTFNSWWGCAKVGPACDDCYAEAVDRRTGENHWGHGSPRWRLSERARNEPRRWQRRADQFEAEHGRRRRVFTLSMGDLFDNEVDHEWRSDHMALMKECDRLDWQVCTKRISNLPKMIPDDWRTQWPQHVGVLITVVTQAEADRDIPRLLRAKAEFGIPWVGVSWEPAQEPIDFSAFLPSVRHHPDNVVSPALTHLIAAAVRTLGGVYLDWIIFGGKSGAKWDDRAFDAEWARPVMDQCAASGCAFFFKQVAAFRPSDANIPPELMRREFPFTTLTNVPAAVAG